MAGERVVHPEVFELPDGYFLSSGEQVNPDVTKGQHFVEQGTRNVVVLFDATCYQEAGYWPQKQLTQGLQALHVSSFASAVGVSTAATCTGG